MRTTRMKMKNELHWHQPQTFVFTLKKSDFSKFHTTIIGLGFKEAYNSKLNINSIGRLWACPFHAPVISFI